MTHHPENPRPRSQRDFSETPPEARSKVRSRALAVVVATSCTEAAEVALARLLEAGETEHREVGRRLHEDLSQQIAGLSLLAGALARQLQITQSPHAEVATDLAAGLVASISAAREIAIALYPVEMEAGGLLAGLHQIARSASREFGIVCTVRHRGPDLCLGERAQIQLYRIIQEALASAIRHGQAKRVTILSRQSKHVVSVSVTDDGMDCTRPHSAGSADGMFLMNSRARLVGATFTVQTPKRGGLRVTCRLES